MATSIEQRAKNVLSKAIQLDEAESYAEAVDIYEAGIVILTESLADLTTVAARKERNAAIQCYLARVGIIKALERSLYRVHRIQIKEGDLRHSYCSVFKQYLDASITRVDVQDSYIRKKYQVLNFMRFCELLVLHCPNLTQVTLTTGPADNAKEQEEILESFCANLKKHNVDLTVTYSTELHDREIRLGNAWIVKIGRGLDYFQKLKDKYSIGFHNFDLRPCCKTTIDIFHTEWNLRK